MSIIALHSKLAKDASSALVDLGAAIKDVATDVEIREMITGTLSKESNVRNAALQALQVSVGGKHNRARADKTPLACGFDGFGLFGGTLDRHARCRRAKRQSCPASMGGQRFRYPRDVFEFPDSLLG